jgi:hypothetical protein
MEGLAGYIATGVVSLAVGLLLRQLEPKSRLVYWLPHNFLFELKDEKVTLRTDSLTLQNLGRKSATNIEIIHKSRPDYFKFATAVAFDEATTPNGEHVIKIASLGAREFINLQLLSYKTLPVLLNIRSAEGPAAPIQIQLQRQFPRWVYAISAVLTLVGLGFTAFWLIKAVAYISKAIGIV